MATSIRRQAFSLEIEPDEIIVRKPKKRPLPVKRPKRKKKLSSFKKSSDRYGHTHLAKALTSGERMSMLRAVERLQGRARILVELACFSNFPIVRLAAISHLNYDADALIEIAKYCQFNDTRAAAVDKLSMKNKALVEIACSSLFKDTRMDAVSLLTDSSSLAEIASRSPNRDSRTAALDGIYGDSSALKKVARDSPYRSTRTEAVRSMSSDTSILCSLVINSSYPDVKKTAASILSEVVEELDDVDALAEIAKISSNEDARYLAIGRLSQDPLALRTVIRESRYRDARSTALMLLSDIVNELDDPDMLAEVAIFSPYEDCRSLAVERLVGQSSALLSVATKSRFKDARELALEKLEGDVEALKSVSRLSKHRGTRKKAHNLVSKPEVFQKELGRILG